MKTNDVTRSEAVIAIDGLTRHFGLTATAWAIAQLRRQNLVSAGTLLGCSVAWLLVASALVGMLAWAVPRELVPLQYLAFAVVFVLPLGRLAATPLALAWNRHR